MAFASVGTFGTFQSATANKSTIAFVTNATLGIENVAVLAIAVDNNASVDGDEVAVTSITDRRGSRTYWPGKS